MSFRGHLRPGQGFRPFTVYTKTGTVTETGRPRTGGYAPRYADGEHLYGIISQASPREQEQWKQLEMPISHTIVQRGTRNRADGNDRLTLTEDGETRYFQVQGKPHDPGELHHFLVYHVLERRDLE